MGHYLVTATNLDCGDSYVICVETDETSNDEIVKLAAAFFFGTMGGKTLAKVICEETHVWVNNNGDRWGFDVSTFFNGRVMEGFVQ